ncbi:MAG: gamma-glutamyltransferase family protein [Lacisediminihabitans sp.]
MTFTAANPFTTRPTLRGSFGMAASTHWLASQSAMAVLERGGNAFDAAVAAAFVLHVVEPHLNGPGGDLVAIAAPAGGVPRVLAGQGPAPRAATIEHYRGLGLELVPGAGLLAATAPGAVDAWLLLLRDHGSWEFGDLAEFALHYARNGYPVLPSIARTIAAVETLFRRHWPGSAGAWLPDGRVPAAGTMLTRPDWARTLERLVTVGRGGSREERIDAVRREWATGFVAHEIDRFARDAYRDSSGADHAGVLRAEDLAEFAGSWEEPVRLDFRGSVILKAGAWTQGPVLLQSLAILDGYPSDRLDPSTPDGAHLLLETLKLALADRDAYYGDGTEAPLDILLSAEYAARRRSQITDVASHDLRPGRLPGRAARVPEPGHSGPARSAAGVGEPTVDRNGETRGDTCHLDIVDRWGNLVSATPSGGWLQSSPHIPELGFCLGSRLQMTWLEHGHPASLAPGRRPRTTLSPTMVLRGGRPVLALGTPGGDQQDQWQLPFLLRHLVGGYELQEAIDAPIMHTTSAPESFWPRERTPGGAIVEDRLGHEVIEGLRARGHMVTVSGPWSLGRLSAVSIHEDGTLGAAANPRGAQGYAVGR